MELFKLLPRDLFGWITKTHFHPCEILVLRLVNKFFYDRYQNYHKIYYHTNHSIFKYAGQFGQSSDFMTWLNQNFKISEYSYYRINALVSFGLLRRKKFELGKAKLCQLAEHHTEFAKNSIEQKSLYLFGKYGSEDELVEFMDLWIMTETPGICRFYNMFFRGLKSRAIPLSYNRYDYKLCPQYINWVRETATFKLGQVADVDDLVIRRIDEYEDDPRVDTIIEGAISTMNHKILTHYADYIEKNKDDLWLDEKHVTPENRTYLERVLNFNSNYGLVEMTIERFIALSDEQYLALLQPMIRERNYENLKVYNRCLKCPTGDKMMLLLELSSAKINKDRKNYHLIFQQNWPNLRDFYDFVGKFDCNYHAWVMKAWRAAQKNKMFSKIEVRFLVFLLGIENNDESIENYSHVADLLVDAIRGFEELLNQDTANVKMYNLIIDRIKFIVTTFKDMLIFCGELKLHLTILICVFRQRVLANHDYSFSLKTYLNFKRDINVILDCIDCKETHDAVIRFRSQAPR